MSHHLAWMDSAVQGALFLAPDRLGIRYGSEGEARAPTWASHAEFADHFACVAFYRRIVDQAPDVISEAKAKDVAVRQLRHDLVRYAPDLAAVFGLGA